MEYTVIIRGKSLPVAVSLKRMKHVRLKVFPSGEIKLSVPVGTPDKWIAEYLVSKTPWIEEKLELLFKQKQLKKRNTLFPEHPLVSWEGN